jgi:hypothetical protein
MANADFERQKQLVEFEAATQAKYAPRYSSSGGYSSGGSSSTLSEDRAWMAQKIAEASGGDGHVSPSDYIVLKNLWTGSGYSGADFDKYFSYAVNTSHAQDYGFPAPVAQTAPVASKPLGSTTTLSLLNLNKPGTSALSILQNAGR